MSYKSIINANADMLNKAERMYRADQTKMLFQSGMSSDQIDKKQSLDSINNKLSLLDNEKKRAMFEITDNYDKNSKVLQSIYENDMKTDVILKKQDKELDYNMTKLNNIKSDIMTLRRQIEISENVVHNRNKKLNFLRIVFVYLLLNIIPLILLKNTIIGKSTAIAISSVLTAIFLLLVVYYFIMGVSRSKIRNQIRYWNSPTLESVLKKDKLSKEELQKIRDLRAAKNKSPLEQYIGLLENDLQKALEDGNYTEAATIRATIDKIQLSIKNGDESGGLGNSENILATMNTYKDKTNTTNKNIQTQLVSKIQKLKESIENTKGIIKTQTETLDGRNKVDKKIEESIRKFKQNIRETNRTIKISEKHIKNLKNV